MTIYLVADYGLGDLAFAEVYQSLQGSFPEASIQSVAVPPFDTYAAAFCIAQLSQQANRDDIIYHNVAPRRQEDSSSEAFLGGESVGGALVVGPGSGASWSLFEGGDLFELLPSATPGQFRSRDLFPAAILEAWQKMQLQGTPSDSRSSFSPPDIRPGTVLYTDGYGNVKTSWREAPAPIGEKLEMNVRGKRVLALVADKAFSYPEGELTLLPGSSGGERPFWEVFLRGGSAARVLDFPVGGSPLLPS